MSAISSLLSSNHPLCLSLLQTCSSMRYLLQIHAQMIRNHLILDPFAASKIIEFCAVSDYGNLHYARRLFDGLSQPNTFVWNTMIRGYAISPFPRPSLHLFRQMLSSHVGSNSYTYPFVVKACAHLSALEEGKQIHGFILKSGADSDVFSVNGLIHMYATCGDIGPARQIFYSSLVRDLVSWNSMLSGYVNCGLVGNARELFDMMPERGTVSWNAMINGYTKCGEIDSARELFDRMPSRSVESWNTLLTGYAKCGFLDVSRKLFDEMPIRNAVSWGAMITAYAQGGEPHEALGLFQEMKNVNVKPNWATIVSVLSACAHLGALERGKQVHLYVNESKMKLDSIIGTALIDMYAKCGCIVNAFRIFKEMASKDVYSWTAMIGGLAVNGSGEKALELFGEMERAGVRPNEVTFVGVLCACCHGGLVQTAKQYFDSMRMVYRIEPQIEHYGCMVDTLGRAGLLEEALSFVNSMPMKPNAMLWGTLLGACWIHGNYEIGSFVLDHLVELKPDDGCAYVLLSNIYATAGRWDDARKVRILMKSKGLSKIPGRSSIEIGGIVHEFYVGDKSHAMTEEIYQMLDEIALRLKLAGYVPNTSPVLFDIEDEEKEHAISHHSEKLAIAFGLISTNAGTPIRIVKNLRVCQDCHTVAKFISEVFKREIVMRDRNIFHYFKGGSCSLPSVPYYTAHPNAWIHPNSGAYFWRNVSESWQFSFDVFEGFLCSPAYQLPNLQQSNDFPAAENLGKTNLMELARNVMPVLSCSFPIYYTSHDITALSKRYLNAMLPRGGEVEPVPVAKTITVDQFGKGDFTTIQSAIDSIPLQNSQWIRVRVRSGIYQEKVTVPPSKAFILLEGDSRDSTIVTWDDAHNLIGSATVSIWADNFIAKRITFKNTYNIGAAINPPKQALAALIYGDKCSFYECGFIGLQDTLFDCLGRHYFNGCYIEGAIDFIFGSGQSIYDKCAINVTANEYKIPIGFITAQGRQNPDEQNGFVFKYCRVFGTMNAYLGRAWKAYSRVIYYRSVFSEIVVPEGWDAWSFKGSE
ncbi:hypothetical protein ACLOJK_017598 [Asimina triloba]